MRRFYLEDIQANTLTLEGDEAHHAQNVLRAKKGDSLVLFDGRGAERVVKVADLNKHRLILTPSGPVQTIDRRPSRALTVAVAYPKARSRSFLTEKLVELGVHAIQPLLSQRGVAPPDTKRLQREALAACKQCGINHLPEIKPACSLPDLVQQSSRPLVLLDPQGEKNPPPSGPLTLICGPEGGFTEKELQSFEGHRWQLAAQTLRSETACLVALARLTE